ncbi:tail protein [Zoogloea oryzae]|uniref:Tail protein n=1 Tax=Zoogloea oryzae TaxID=310767 RepID=A0ABQ6FAW2_9RHOO|nr:DNA circularization N-terminal domain-containing protein [Zoogloea oryzae]GLT22698.1 tail protein [Zoogloea oryzae]
MSWRDRLQRGSFRGFDFLTDSHEAKGGRRLVVHEFPGADEPIVEDLGGKAREWRVVAYFIGADYDRERNGFLALLAEGVADWLTHPWLGKVWARAREWSVSESNERGGYAAVSIDFVAGGRAPYVPDVDKVDAAIDRVRRTRDAIAADFSLAPMPLDVMTRFRSQVSNAVEGLRTVIALTALPVAQASTVISSIQGIKGDLATLLATPASYAAALASLADTIGNVQGLTDPQRVRAVARLAQVAKRTAAEAVPAGSNTAREATVRARMVATAAVDLALADYTTAAARDAAQAGAVGVLDVLLPTMPDALFETTWELRTGVIEALASQALDPAQVRDVVSATPAVVLAHRLDADEDVFNATNGVRHPLFVQGRVHG